MNRIMIGLATAAGLTLCAGMANADPAGFVAPTTGGGVGLATFAQLAGPNTLFGAGDLPPGRMPDKYGLHPCLKKFFHIPTASGPGMPYGPYGANGHNPLTNSANWAAGGYGMNGPAQSQTPFPGGGYGPGGMAGGYGPGGMPGPGGMHGPGGPYGPMGPPMQGTLAFPYNSLTRSPRDYFMMDLNK
jgi:hypothetical protein